MIPIKKIIIGEKAINWKMIKGKQNIQSIINKIGMINNGLNNLVPNIYKLKLNKIPKIAKILIINNGVIII